MYVFEPGKKTSDNFGLNLRHFIKYKGTACPVRQVMESPLLILIPYRKKKKSIHYMFNPSSKHTILTLGELEAATVAK